ncbi:hypothetical protein [Massilia sp. ST3]|uniref:hypothetical protein n=1 Tax=Massilia sp. ST3 TaxID=2824903 RepID=UPI001B822332|nr:hypothetical protein [Massilia sp. ST3]MBQ5946113.1 hypothetical protein [Massilia sp. ST3]
MRNLSLEAALWNCFASPEFFDRAASECEAIMEWFGTLAVSKQVANIGRNNQIYDKFAKRAREFRHGAELARLGDYQLIWDIADLIRGDVRGMMEQPLHAWMTEAEYREFSDVKISRLLAYSDLINRALTNAMEGAESFFDSDPEFAERRNDDDAFPGDEIVEVYEESFEWFTEALLDRLPDPLPEYVIDRSVSCRTGKEVPWTGVWYPGTGLEHHTLVFAVKGLRMQPVYRFIKTAEQREFENKDKHSSCRKRLRLPPFGIQLSPLVVKRCRAKNCGRRLARLAQERVSGNQ